MKVGDLSRVSLELIHLLFNGFVEEAELEVFFFLGSLDLIEFLGLLLRALELFGEAGYARFEVALL